MNRYPVKDPLAFVADGSEDDNISESDLEQDEMNEDDEEMKAGGVVEASQ